MGKVKLVNAVTRRNSTMEPVAVCSRDHVFIVTLFCRGLEFNPIFKFFLKLSVPRYLFNETCTSDECSTDLGLTCLDEKCECSEPDKFWSKTSSNCSK